MGARTRIIVIFWALTGISVLCAIYLLAATARHGEGAPASGALVTAVLPAHHDLSGEAVTDGTLHPLMIMENGLSGPQMPDALTLRLRDSRQHYYDIEIGRTIRLSGLAPRTPVTVSFNAQAANAIPADWSGRLVLDTPRRAPFDISFRQNGHDYRIGITRQIGGAV